MGAIQRPQCHPERYHLPQIICEKYPIIIKFLQRQRLNAAVSFPYEEPH
jgi:hypothetical protein